MKHYSRSFDYLLNLPSIRSWTDAQYLIKEMQSVLEKKDSRKSEIWHLPLFASEAVGKTQEVAIPAMVASACLVKSIRLVDDMLDNDPKGFYHQVGHPKAANLAVALQAVAFEAITQCNTTPATKLALFNHLNQMALNTAWGQHLDVEYSTTEEDYWQIIQNKSVPAFSNSLEMGALLGGATEKTKKQLGKLGDFLAKISQVSDDLRDAMNTPSDPDWLENRPSLPILFAKTTTHPDKTRFLQLCQSISNPEALEEAQIILVRCGAVSYCINYLLNLYQTAQKLLAEIDLVYYQKLEQILESMIIPAKELLAKGEVRNLKD